MYIMKNILSTTYAILKTSILCTSIIAFSINSGGHPTQNSGESSTQNIIKIRTSNGNDMDFYNISTPNPRTTLYLHDPLHKYQTQSASSGYWYENENEPEQVTTPVIDLQALSNALHQNGYSPIPDGKKQKKAKKSRKKSPLLQLIGERSLKGQLGKTWPEKTQQTSVKDTEKPECPHSSESECIPNFFVINTVAYYLARQYSIDHNNTKEIIVKTNKYDFSRCETIISPDFFQIQRNHIEDTMNKIIRVKNDPCTIKNELQVLMKQDDLPLPFVKQFCNTLIFQSTNALRGYFIAYTMNNLFFHLSHKQDDTQYATTLLKLIILLLNKHTAYLKYSPQRAVTLFIPTKQYGSDSYFSRCTAEEVTISSCQELENEIAEGKLKDLVPKF